MRRTKLPAPAHADRPNRGPTRPFAVHERNPAGSKIVRRFYKSKFGERGSYAEAADWNRKRIERGSHRPKESAQPNTPEGP